MQKTPPPHIAIIPTPGMGHLIPLTELARRLTEFNFTITILIPNDGSPPPNFQLSLLQNLPSSISHLYLSPVDLTDLHSPNSQILLTLTRSIPAIRDSLRVLSESTRLVAFVVDLFGSLMFDLAQEFGILAYIFFPTSASGLCHAFTLQKLDKIHTCEFRDLPELIEIFPGSVLIRGADLPDPVQDRKHEVYEMFLDIFRSYVKAAGIMVNSYVDLEPVALKYLMENGRREYNIPPVYPIGPVIRTGSLEGEGDDLNSLKWLNEQPNNSVLFVSFGSGGTLSHEQLVELALGLELSGQRFLWVIKTPHDIASSASYLGIDSFDNPLEYLPQGFLNRTKGLGLVVHGWAPQVEILSHGSIGGFLTHCGWNSILESIVHGVPLIAWPLYAEQRLNAVLVTEDLKVAMRVKPTNEKGLIQREQIAEYAKCLIEGDQGKLLREKMRVLKEDGSSKQSLASVTQVLMNHKNIAN